MKKETITSFEQALLELGNQPDARDKRARKRVQLLAQLLWTRALNNDPDAVRLLLNRLPPQAIPPPEPEPQHKVTDPYEDLIVVLKALVEANVIPAKYFEIFQKNEQDQSVQ